MTKCAKVIAVSAISIGFSIVSACSPKNEAPTDWATAVKEASADRFDILVEIITDPRTGCQYLWATGMTGRALYPRMNAAGRQICDGPTQ